MANEQIKYTKAIFVEGTDEVNFFTALFKTLNKSDIEILNVGGKEKLKEYFPAAIKRPNFDNITSYAIIVDADKSFENTFKSIVDLLIKHSQPAPKKDNEYVDDNGKRVGIYVMPGSLEAGMLEDLCLKTVETHPAIPHLEKYFDGLRSALIDKPENEKKDPNKFFFPKNISKAKALAFLAALHEPFSSVGIAALNGYWNFEHTSLNDLKKFLQQL